MTTGTKSFLDPAQRPTHVVCPKCQLRQPLALDCVGCGAIIDDFGTAPASAAPPVTPAPAPAAPAPPVAPAAPAARARRAPAPAFGDEIVLDGQPLDFIPLLDEPPPAPAPPPPQAEPAGNGSGLAAGSGVYQGRNPFSDDGAHSRYGTRGPDTSYEGGHFRAEQLSAFTVLGEAFSLLARNLVGFTLIAVVAMLPAIIFSLHTTSEILAFEIETGGVPVESDVRNLLFLVGLNALFSFVCMPIATAGVTYGVGREMRKEPTTVIDCVQAGVRVLIPVIGVTLVQSVLVGVVGVVVMVAATAALMGVLSELPCLGVTGLFVPVFLILTFAGAFAVTIPATVEERPGVFGALKTSWQLTQGARLTIAFFYCFLGVIAMAIFLLLSILGGMVGPESAGLGAQLAQIIVTALNAAGAAVFYFRLRSAAEGVPIAQLSSAA